MDPNRKTAFVRFKQIQQAESAAATANTIDPDTGNKYHLLREPNHEALILYVIPEISKEEILKKNAAENKEGYDPLSDDKLTLEQAQMYISEKNKEVKLAFKAFCDAEPDSAEKADN